MLFMARWRLESRVSSPRSTLQLLHHRNENVLGKQINMSLSSANQESYYLDWGGGGAEPELIISLGNCSEKKPNKKSRPDTIGAGMGIASLCVC